jgi:hypothetical protein
MAYATGEISISLAGANFDSATYPRFVLGDGTNSLTFVIDNNARGLMDTEGSDAKSGDYTGGDATTPLEDSQKGRLVVPTFDEADGATKALLAFELTDQSNFQAWTINSSLNSGGGLAAITTVPHFIFTDSAGDTMKVGISSGTGSNITSDGTWSLVAKYGSSSSRYWLYKKASVAEYWIRCIDSSGNDWRFHTALMQAVNHAEAAGLIDIEAYGATSSGTLQQPSSIANDTYTVSESNWIIFKAATAGFVGNASSMKFVDGTVSSGLTSDARKKSFKWGYDEYLASDSNINYSPHHSTSPTDDQFWGKNFNTPIYFRQGTMAGSGSDASLSTANIAEAIKEMINGSILGITATRSSSTVSLTNDASGTGGNVTITTTNAGSLFTVSGMEISEGGTTVAKRLQISARQIALSGSGGLSGSADNQSALVLDLAGLSTETLAYGDVFAFADATDDLPKKVSFANMIAFADGTGLTATNGVLAVDAAQTQITSIGTIATGVWEGTDVGVAHGGTGVSTLTDGGILLGSGAGAITAMAVLSDGQMIVGDGTTDPVAESGATLRTSIGVGTGDSPQFTAVNVGAASDTTLARSSAGNLSVEGNLIYRAGGTDVPVADGGTGASTFTDGGILLGSGTSAISATAVLADGEMLVGDASGDPAIESGATLRTSIGVGTGDNVTFTAIAGSTGTFSGILKSDDATEATSTTDGSLQTDGGLSVAKDVITGNDIYLLNDGAVLGLGDGKDVKITHDGGTGATLASAGAFILDGASTVQVDSDAALTLGGLSIDMDADGGALALDGTTGVSLGTATSAVAVSIGHTTSETTVNDNLTVTGDLTVNGTTVSVDATTINISSSFTFEGPADAHETTFHAGTPTTDLTVYLPQFSASAGTSAFYLPALIDAPTDASSKVTAAEFALLDGASSVATVTVVDGDGVLFNDGGSMKQITVQSLAAYFDDEITSMPNLATAAALVTVGTIGTGVWQGTAIATGYIAADAIDGTKLADDAVDSEHYTDASIDLAHMSVNSVDSDQYVDGSIDLVHMSANSVDSDQYVDGSIDTAHIANDAITAALMADNSIDSDMYVDGSIDNAHLADDAVDSDEIAAGAIDLAHMSVNSIDSDQYVDGSIDTAHFAAGAVDAAAMGANSVDSSELVDGSVDLSHMSVNSIDSDQYVDGSIDLVHMSVNSIDSDQYVDGSIDTVHIGDDQVTAAKLASDVSGAGLQFTNGVLSIGYVEDRYTGTAVAANAAFASGYYLSQTPATAAAVSVYFNGLMQSQGTDYTISGTVITLANDNSLSTEDEVVLKYIKQ